MTVPEKMNLISLIFLYFFIFTVHDMRQTDNVSWGKVNITADMVMKTVVVVIQL